MTRPLINEFPIVEINFNPEVPVLKEFKDITRVNIRYSLIEPFCFAHIYWDENEFELKYQIEEPELDEQEKKWRKEISEAMSEVINFDNVVEKEDSKLKDYIDQVFRAMIIEFGIKMEYESFKKIYYYLCRDFLGYNEADPLLRDYFVEDIECNGANSPVYIVHRKFRNLKTNLIYSDIEVLASFVEKLAQRSGKYVSYAQPILDSSLPDGSRVNATYTKDISSKGPTFTIRKFTKTPWTPPQLIAFNTMSPEMLAYLWILIEHKMNILVAGGTGSGKTTLLNALAFFIPAEDRVVSIEDTRELNLPRDNWLPSVVRTATSGNDENEIDLFTLLKASFRQRPDYVIVGEVRGKEAFVLFQGMASGHSSLSTIHADSVDTVIKRLETPPIELSPTLLNTLDCLCIMTYAIVNRQETRKLKEIVEIVNVSENGTAMTNTPFVWNPSDDQFYFKKESKIFDKLTQRFGISRQEIEKEFQSRVKLLYKLFQEKTFEFEEVQNIIHEYYKRPESVLKRYGVA